MNWYDKLIQPFKKEQNVEMTFFSQKVNLDMFNYFELEFILSFLVHKPQSVCLFYPKQNVVTVLFISNCITFCLVLHIFLYYILIHF